MQVPDMAMQPFVPMSSESRQFLGLTFVIDKFNLQLNQKEWIHLQQHRAKAMYTENGKHDVRKIT